MGAAKAVEFVRRVLASPRVKLVPVDPEDFSQALATYSRIGGDLSFTDVVSVTVMQGQGCAVIASHDSGFDRVKGIERRQSV
ncbi:MAG: PIN domain-containing protein [Candidatus Thermoplasmatota archaeon]